MRTCMKIKEIGHTIKTYGQLCGHFVSLPQPSGFGHITSGYAVRSAHPNPYGLRIPTGR